MIDQEIDKINRYADNHGRLDPIATAAANSNEVTEQTIRSDLDYLRGQFQRAVTEGGV